MIKIAVLLEKCEEGGFAVSVPTIPGCFSQGETVSEALSNITEAIELHLEAIDDDLIVDEDTLVKELVWKSESDLAEAQDPGKAAQRTNGPEHPKAEASGHAPSLPPRSRQSGSAHEWPGAPQS